MQTGAQTVNYLYAGRAISGLGVGFLTMIIREFFSFVFPSFLYFYFIFLFTKYGLGSGCLLQENTMEKAKLYLTKKKTTRGKKNTRENQDKRKKSSISTCVGYIYLHRLSLTKKPLCPQITIAVYQSEIAHPSIRGRVTGLQQFMLGIGALIAGWVSWACYTNLSGSGQWRVPLGIQILPAVILAPLIMLFPESPRWLIDHNRADEGLSTLARLHSGGDATDAWVRAEFDQIRETLQFEHDNEAQSYLELFSTASSFRRLLLACALQAATQMTGVSAIQYFSVPIFAQIGIEGDDALKYQAINSILALIAQAACMLTIDRFGRRPVLILGNLVNCVMWIVVAVLLALFPPGSASGGSAGWGFIIV